MRLRRLDQNAFHARGVSGFFAARAVFEDDAVAWVYPNTGGGGEEEVGVRFRTRGVLGRDNSVKEVRDVDPVERRVHVRLTTGRSDSGLMAEPTDVVYDIDDLRAGGDVLLEVFLEEGMPVGEE